MLQNITYFSAPGKANTAEALSIAKKRAQELGVRQIVLASSHGYTAQEAANVFAGTGIELIAVTISEGYREEGWCMTPEERQEAARAGVKVLTAHMSLSGGVADAFAEPGSPPSVIANTLYCFSQGMKVAVEITIMAAEAGWVPTNQEVIAIAGSDQGADTAIVLVPACARRFKELRIREILCKPRVG